MDPFFSNISITILTAIISGFLGAWFQYWFQNRKVNKVRGIAIKALKIFQGYAKKKQTFDICCKTCGYLISYRACKV